MHRSGYLLLAPALVALTLTFALPLLTLALDSLHGYLGMGRLSSEWTLANYSDLFADDYFLRLFLRTFLLAALVCVICIVLGFPLAYWLARTRSSWRPAFTFICVAPLIVSAVIRNLGWIPILSENGLLNWVVRATRLSEHPVALLGTVPGVAIVLAHALLPFMVLTLKTVIERIPPELEDAARSLGASPFAACLRVVVPLSKTGLATGSVLVVTAVLGSLVTPSMIGGGKVQVVAIYIDQQFRALLNYPAGATVALLLLLVTWLCIAAGSRRQKERS